MFILLLCFLTSFALSYLAVPHVIKIARDRNLCERPTNRSSHTISTPALGGIGIFCGTVFAVVMWTPFQLFANLQYILCALLIMFLVGIRDDLEPVQPTGKILAQIMAAAIIVFQGDITLRGLYGFFGVHEVLPLPVFRGFTLFVMMVIINGINLIDGINGLAGSIGLLVAGVFGCWFFFAGRVELAVLAFALVGAILAFLKFNYTPAKTFMGDSGSLVIGLVCAILTVEFIEVNHQLPASTTKVSNGPAAAIGIMILPLYDSLRVFVTRVFRGKSPFAGDRSHIHHLLIDYGLSHMQATASLTVVNGVFITLVFVLDPWVDVHLLAIILLALATALTYALQGAVVRRKQRRMAV